MTQTELDDIDTVILADHFQALDKVKGPKVGDWVEYPNGTQRRISYVWYDGSIQTSDGGSWYLGKGYVSFSGGLYPSTPRSIIQPTIRTLPGRVWFFHHNHRRAHNAVGATIPFPIWVCDVEPTR